MVLGNRLGADMKTRQEMIYDFTLAMATNWPDIKGNLWREGDDLSDSEVATEIIECAMSLADEYLKHLG
jgi:hypothetical protein